MKRIAKSQFYYLFIACFVVLCMSNKLYAQCDVTTPTFNVDLTLNVDSIWTLNSVSRVDSCCNRANASENCIQFNVELHAGASSMAIYMTSPSPPGPVYFYIDCDSTGYLVGDTVSFPSGGHSVTLCKSGSDQPTYSIVSIKDLSVAAGSDQNICAGDSTQINTMVSGGVAPYVYSWSPATGLSSDTAANPLVSLDSTTTYIVTVTDSLGISATDNVTINTSPFSVSISSISNMSCNGSCDGSAKSSASCGTIPYTYNWSNGQTGQNITFACAGTYTVTAYDALSNKAWTSVTLTEPSALSISFSSTDASCGASDGSVCATASGGVAPYAYAWSMGSTTNCVVSLAAGGYTITATDANGCLVSQAVTVNDSSGLNVGYTVSGDSCLGGTYSFTNTGVSPSSCGMSCPTFYWDFDDGSTAYGFTSSEANPSHIYAAAGTYSVSFSIFNGSCSDTITKSVTVYDCGCSLGIITNSTDESCLSSCDGSASVSGFGGSLPYTYSWSNGVTTSTISSLCPGTYNLTVTDDSSCQKTQSVTVNSGFDLAVGFNYVGDTCINNAINFTNTGAASNTCGMGCPTFFWNLGDGNTSTDENPIHTYSTQGSYIVYQTLSGLGCAFMDSQQVIITNCIVSLSIISIADTVLCGGDTIQLSSVANGGVPPYSYLWTPNIWMDNSVVISPMVSPNSSIWYTVTITDSVGTQTVDSVFVDVSNITPVANFTYVQVDSLTVNFYDSSQNAFSYDWNLGWMGTGTYSTLQNPSYTYSFGGSYNVCLIAYDSIGACSNNYCQLVNVEDSSCSITVNAGVDTNIQAGEQIVLNGSHSGTMDKTLIVAPGTAIPDNNPSGITSIITNTDSLSTYVLSSVCVNITHAWNEDLDIYLSCSDTSVGEIELSTDNGSSGDNYVDACFDRTSTVNINTLAADTSSPITGNYLPEQALSLLDGCPSSGQWTLRVSDDAMFFSGTLDSWSITFEKQGGGNVSYYWTPSLGLSDTSILTPTFIPPDTGTYQFVLWVQDSLCAAVDTVQIIVGDSAVIIPLSVGAEDISNLNCKGDTITLNANVTGGVSPYTYSWQGSGVFDSTAQTINAVLATSNTYFVTVTDSVGNQSLDSITISLTPDSICFDLVWPGDVNNDGVANIYDIFPIGLGYKQTGIARDSISTVWQGWPSQDWPNTFPSGLNYKYADCDGDGKIYYDDVFAIADNYGLTHAKSKSTRSPGSPQLFFSFAKDTMNTGDSVIARINLGKPSAPVNQIYGLAFTINFNPLLIDSSSITIDFDSSQFGSTTDTSIIKITNIDAIGGTVDISIIRTDGNNVTVKGTVAKLRFVIIDNISGKDSVAAMLNLDFGDVEAIQANEDTVLLDAVPYSSPIVQSGTGYIELSELNDKIKIFPNPAMDYLHIEANGMLKLREVCFINILGEVAYCEKPSGQDHLLIKLDHMLEGIYFCIISTDQGTISKRVTIIR